MARRRPVPQPPVEPDDTALAAWAAETLGHRFENLALLRTALTHSSVAATRGGRSYQRLEFLGDRVLGCVVAAWLFRDHRDAEGPLTSRLHALVEGPANARVSRALGVPDRIDMDPRMRLKGLADNENVLGDVAEAIVGAIFIDAGWDAAEAFVRREWGRLAAAGTAYLVDPKSKLQQWALQRQRGMPVYIVIDRQGPDHAPRFTVEASIRGEAPAVADGNSKQEAEKAAAAALLARIDP